MRESFFNWVLGLIFILFAALPFTQNITYAESNENNVQELIIKYSTNDYSVEPRMTNSVEKEERISSQVKLLTLKEGIDSTKVQSELEKDSSVEYVEPNYQRELSYVVNDPYYDEQWWVPHVKAESMWLHYQSQQQSTVVAVVDSGIDPHHEDLKGRIASGGYNFYSDNTNYTDYDGHGTNVSGVIAAQAGNGHGISGIVGPYDVSILPLKVSVFGTSYASDIIKAIDYSISKNVDVINISLGGTEQSIAENEAIQRAVQAGITVVASAGNEAQSGNPLIYPAAYPNVISVGAVNEQNERSHFSSYNSSVDLVAPGENILTTSPSQRYDRKSGTSLSAPIVSGTIAMIKGLEPELTNNKINDLLKSSATDLGIPGNDPYYGAGLLDVEKLSEQLVTSDPIEVSGIELNTDYIHMDIEKEHDSFTVKEEHLEQLEHRRNNSNIIYEQEPNNDFATANKISLNSGIVGTITDYYYDLDYFQFTVEQQGVFALLGTWIESAFVDASDNRYLAIALYDDNANLLNASTLQTMSSGQSSQYLTEELKEGTYYLVVLQTSPYEYLFTNESYLITTIFTPNEEEPKPEILFDYAFMKKGEEEPFTTGTHSESEFNSTDPSVATVDSTGVVRAVGHGKTVISHTIGTEVQESVVKVTEDLKSSTAALFEKVQPKNATNKNVTWKSSNEEVATVDEYGIITAIGNGEANITVTTEDGGHQASAMIEVEGGETEIIGDFPEMEVKPSKVFTVVFNQELDVNKEYKNDIIISKKANGQQPVPSFTVEVNKEDSSELFITPTTEWEEGTYYLTVKKETQNKKGEALNKDVVMKFIVEQ